MPNRILREGINTSERVNRLTEKAEIFYRRLMSVVDDYGRHNADWRLLRASCYPLRIETVVESDLVTWLRECEDADLIKPYEARGCKYLQLTDFRQQIRSKSKCPDPPSRSDIKPAKQPDIEPDNQVAHLDEDEDECVSSKTESETKTNARPPAGHFEPDIGKSIWANAENAMSRWSSIAPPVGRGHVVNIATDSNHIRLMLQALGDCPPVIRAGSPVDRRHLVAEAVDRLIGGSKMFKHIGYACGCVKNLINDMANGADEHKPQSKAQKTLAHNMALIQKVMGENP